MADGSGRQLCDVRTGDMVMTYDGERNGITVSNVTDFMQQGIKPCVELKFNDGRRLQCTADHEILTHRGWVEAQHIRIDTDAVYSSVQAPRQVTYSEDAIAEPAWTLELPHTQLILSSKSESHNQRLMSLARICGYSFAVFISQAHNLKFDGILHFEHAIDVEAICSDIRVLLGNDEKIEVDDVVDGSPSFAVQVPDALAKDVTDLIDLYADNFMSKFVSLPCIMLRETTSLSFKREWIASMFGGAACMPRFNEIRDDWSHIKLECPDQKLTTIYIWDMSRQLRELLVQLGGHSKDRSQIHQRSCLQQVSAKSSFALSRRDTLAFYERIGVRYNAQKQLSLGIAAAWYRGQNSQRQRNRKPYVSRTAFHNARLNDSDKCTGDALPVQLVKLVERFEVAPQTTYDITVARTHNFIANSIVVHNCGHCLTKFYRESASAIVDKGKWTCPSCRGICCCAACRRRKSRGAGGHSFPAASQVAAQNARDTPSKNKLKRARPVNPAGAWSRSPPLRGNALGLSPAMHSLTSPHFPAEAAMITSPQLQSVPQYDLYASAQYALGLEDDNAEVEGESEDDSDAESASSDEGLPSGQVPQTQFYNLLGSHIRQLAGDASRDAHSPFARLYRSAQTPTMKRRIATILARNELKREKKVDMIANLLLPLQGSAGQAG